MKVLHIIDHLNIGGAQTILKGILEKEKNNKNIFCYVLKNSKAKIKINSQNLYLCKNYSRLNVRSLFELKKIIKNENVDILHCHLMKAYILGYLLKLLFFKNIKLVFHEHGEIFINRKWYSCFVKIAQKKVNLLIAVSEATKNKLMENAGVDSNKIKILHNFVDLEKFGYDINNKYNNNRSKKNEELKIKDNDFVVGFAARIVRRKGCYNLISAFGELRNIKNIKLIIAGEGHEKNNYVKLINKLKLNDKVFFLGAVLNMAWFYSIIDCFVIPSHWEPFGIVALEAQATKVPVIASNTGGLNEIISDKKTGLLFEPENEKDLAKKIELIYNNEELRKKLAENGFESVKKYSLGNYLIKLENIYHELF